MKLIFAMTLLLLLTPVVFGEKPNKNNIQEFKTLTDRYFADWSSLNPDNASHLYAKDSDLIFYDITPLKYTGWAEYNKGARTLLNGFDNLKLTPNNDLKVTCHNNVCWTTVTFHLSAKQKSGGQLEIDDRHTAIWEKRVGKWLIVHEHFSTPLPE